MALESRIGKGYAWRLVIIAGVCLVFGVWGIYDYAIDIPRRQKAADRLALLDQARIAMETEQPAGTLTEEAAGAREAAQAEISRLATLHLANALGETEITTPEELRRAISATPVPVPKEDLEWMQLLTGIVVGLSGERHLPLSGTALQAYEGIEAGIEQIGAVTAPAKYDRIMQWGFILCLPCAPYLLWMWWKIRKVEYRLDDDGTLRVPESTWKADDIADIDMSRWMAKSIATVVHRDGTRVPLDDYKFKDLYLIVGAIAARLHPDDWTDEAKPVKSESGGESEGQGEAEHEAKEEASGADREARADAAETPSAPVDA